MWCGGLWGTCLVTALGSTPCNDYAHVPLYTRGIIWYWRKLGSEREVVRCAGSLFRTLEFVQEQSTRKWEPIIICYISTSYILAFLLVIHSYISTSYISTSYIVAFLLVTFLHSYFLHFCFLFFYFLHSYISIFYISAFLHSYISASYVSTSYVLTYILFYILTFLFLTFLYSTSKTVWLSSHVIQRCNV